MQYFIILEGIIPLQIITTRKDKNFSAKGVKFTIIMFLDELRVAPRGFGWEDNLKLRF